jgi:hypothetical protein
MNAIKINIKSVFTLLLISGFLTVVPFAVHADPGVSGSPQQELTQSDLETFAKAYTEVTQIYTVYEHRITESSEPEQATALQQEANEKMNQAVMDNGLSIEDYNAIYRTIEQDPALQQQFTQVLSETP